MIKKENIKILHCLNEGSIGGGQLHVLWFIQTCKEYFREFENHVLLNESGLFTEQLQKENIPFTVFSIDRIPKPNQILNLKKFISRSEYAVIHVHGGIPAFWLKLCVFVGYKGKIVYTYHGIHFHYFNNLFRKFIYSNIDRFTNHLTDYIILTTQAELDIATERHLVKNNKYRLIRFGLPYNENDEMNDDEIRQFRIQYNLENKLVIGTIGRLHFQKGYDTFLQVIQSVVSKNPDLSVIIIGDGPQKEWLESEIIHLDLQPKVILLGSVKNASRLISVFDIFLLTSRWEGFGLVNAEAFFRKKPVVSSRLKPVAELVDHNVNGFLAERENISEFVRYIQELIDHPELRKQFGENGYLKVTEEYQLKRMAHEITEVYRELIR